MQARVEGKFQSRGLNLLQMSPNWFLGIWTLGHPSKVGLIILLLQTVFCLFN
jgi:hypothetical protein